MHGGCSPKLFYQKHRPLLSGWRDNPSLPDGLVYQGVSDTGLHYSGGSAAQSAALQIIDAGLGVKHSGPEGDFLVRMRNYMPPNQRDLLAFVAQGPTLRIICQNSGNPDILQLYNICLDKLANFRRQHLILVSRYITTQVTIG